MLGEMPIHGMRIAIRISFGKRCLALFCVTPSAVIVPVQVQRLFESEGIFPDAYRIMEFQGSSDSFSDGRVVLKVHFTIPGQTEK